MQRAKNSIENMNASVVRLVAVEFSWYDLRINVELQAYSCDFFVLLGIQRRRNPVERRVSWVLRLLLSSRQHKISKPAPANSSATLLTSTGPLRFVLREGTNCSLVVWQQRVSQQVLTKYLQMPPDEVSSKLVGTHREVLSRRLLLR